MPNTNKIGIIAFVPDLYDSYAMSRHHILTGISQTRKVLWVSPPIYWKTLSIERKNFRRRGLKKHSDNLWCFAPRIPSDYARGYSQRGVIQSIFRQYTKLWDKLFVRKLRRLVRQMNVDDVILYIWRPEFGKYMGKFSEIMTCYHIVDEYSFNPHEDEPISPEETYLLSEADLVFIHSKTLLQKKGHINPNTHYVPNGVDFAHYARVLDQNLEAPPDISSIPHPRIGYMGHVKRHIDLPLLHDLAEARPDWSFVLVGPIQKTHSDIVEAVAALESLSNVHFLGGKPAHELPLYINAFDVSLMPYRQTQYTKYIYPLKLHEYLACGQPVVATPLANLQEFADVLYFAEGEEQWLPTIERALHETDQELRIRRKEVARENSWDSRVRTIIKIFDQNMTQYRNTPQR